MNAYVLILNTNEMSYKNIVHHKFNIYIYISEPSTYVIGGPDMFVDVGSMVNLSCVVSFTEKPPDKVLWLHNEEEISFRGPRSGVSVSAIFILL